MITNTIGENTIIRTCDLEELQALVKRQRVIIEMFIKATEPIENHIVFYQNPAPNFNIMDILRAREAAQDTTSMTGASEK